MTDFGAEFSIGGKGDGANFLISAGIVYGIIAAACSSPQTTEINADKRADTLMKWVHIGIAQAAIFIGIAAFIDPAHRMAIIGGGSLAAGLMYGQYVHAKSAGQNSIGESTEGHTSGKGMSLKTSLLYNSSV